MREERVKVGESRTLAKERGIRVRTWRGKNGLYGEGRQVPSRDVEAEAEAGSGSAKNLPLPLPHRLFAELGTANLHSIPQPQIPQNCKRGSATANPQVCDRFAVTFRSSATANAHCISANLDPIIYCYFVFVMTFFICEGQILPLTRR